MSTVSTVSHLTVDDLVRDAIAELDREPIELDPQHMSDEADFWTVQRRRVRATRMVAVGGAIAVSACLWVSARPNGDLFFTANILAFLLLGVGLCGYRSARAQLVSRASLWALAMLGCGVWLIFMPSDPGSLQWVADGYAEPERGGVLGVIADLLFTVVPLVALLTLGMHGLERPGETDFRPVAFRRLFALSLVLGIADAMWLAVVGVAASLVDPSLFSWVPWLLAAALMVGAWGLYRLRTWGLAVMALANVVEVVLLLRFPEVLLGPELMMLILTAGVQLLLPIPVYTAMLRGRPATASLMHRIGRWLPALVLVLLTVAVVIKWSTVMVLVLATG